MDILTDLWLGKPLWVWAGFFVLVLGILAFDLGILHKKNEEVSVGKSLRLSALYILIGLAYGGWVWLYLGADSGMAYLTGYVVEKTLALDNIFVIALIFSFFAVPPRYQHRALFWGILGVIVLRAVMIALGATIVHQFAWGLHLFAAFLILAGVKMLASRDAEPDLAANPVVRLMRKWFAVTDGHRGEAFVVREPDPKTGRLRLYVTPLLMALVTVEFADVVFAIDSIPAIFAIVDDPFIVYTSNIFAILGLRALYFALAALIAEFRYLKPALALVLVFIGSKVFVADLLGLDKFPTAISLGVTVGLIALGVVASLVDVRVRRRARPAE